MLQNKSNKKQFMFLLKFILNEMLIRINTHALCIVTCCTSQSNIGLRNIVVEKYMSHAVCKLTKHHVMIISCYDFDVANKT